MSQNSELCRLAFGKMILPLVPSRLKRRVAMGIYNHTSPSVQGIDIVVKQPGYKLMVNTKDLIGWNVFFFAEYEKSTNNVLGRFIKPGDTVIEAGANIGTETILLANLVGDNGKVYAFEPNKDVFNRLKHNAQVINKKNNVVCLDIALGEKDGTIQFNVYPDDYFNSGMSSKYHGATDVVDVPQRTLDSMVSAEEISKVDFIKMDVQGAEPDVLAGAKNTMERFRPGIFLEADEHVNELFDTLTGADYTVYVIGDSGLEPIDKNAIRKAETHTNWLALPKEKAT
ncbi:FkbM family methyltransferase [Polluticoccus soli]|uniref:FkbM family methyltransferase n=1 Tax=Polluticoccus soli TaxID=3034150 RepID=UPI0023E25706|nr:FkbM family methyltransferase [Flavipsychrobacter sp. JY13-12]